MAQLNKVTITGADDLINPQDLIDISVKYPFVEFAILFSLKKMGQNRYPTLPWVLDLAELVEKVSNNSINLAAHFCGQLTKDTQTGKPRWVRLLKSMKTFKRIQLNGFDVTQDFNRVSLDDYGFDYIELGLNYILQIGSEKDLPAAKDIAFKYLNPPAVLFDASGGRGIKADYWPKCPQYLEMGFAGGINPDNVISVVEELNAREDVKNYWIDMETGIRTNDKFDLAKVCDILEKCEPYIISK